MPTTPSQRTTRSNSNSQNFTLNDIKSLIDNCKSEILTTVKSQIEKVTNMIAPLLIRVDELEKENKKLMSRVDQLERKQEGLASSSGTSETISQAEFIREMEERHRRQDFLIISGLPDDRAGSVEDRKQRDKALVSSLVQEIGHSEFVPVDMLRIGDLNTPSPRLLRVKCPSKETRTALLYDAKNLRFSQAFKKVFINPDLTRKQRESNKKLRAEVKRRREAGETVFIRDGHLIEGGKKNFL